MTGEQEPRHTFFNERRCWRLHHPEDSDVGVSKCGKSWLVGSVAIFHYSGILSRIVSAAASWSHVRLVKSSEITVRRYIVPTCA